MHDKWKQILSGVTKQFLKVIRQQQKQINWNNIVCVGCHIYFTSHIIILLNTVLLLIDFCSFWNQISLSIVSKLTSNNLTLIDIECKIIPKQIYTVKVFYNWNHNCFKLLGW